MMQPQFTACIICRDDRAEKWMQLLLDRCTTIYVVSSINAIRKFSQHDRDGLIVARLPEQLDLVLFHSGDESVWQSLHPQARSTFEFNAPGTVLAKPGIIPILRPTAPHFGIEKRDVIDLIDYVIGDRASLPSFCHPALAAIPALALLFQTYLAIPNRHRVEQATWWLTALGDMQNLQAQLSNEWEWLNLSARSRSAIDEFLQSLLTQTFSNELAQTAADTLLPVIGGKVEPISIPSQIQCDRILAVDNDVASPAIALSIATWLNLPFQILRTADSIKKERKPSLLILNESQLEVLPKLRLQGLNSAILVVSSDPFTVLKQKYRILRFGQGSHEAFQAPWTLQTLLNTATALVPLEPENLRYLQTEMKASEKLRNQQIQTCLKQLEQFNGDRTFAIEQLTQTIAELRADARVACHAVVRIQNEPKQLQQHFQIALEEIQTDQHPQAIERLQITFMHLRELLLSTDETRLLF